MKIKELVGLVKEVLSLPVKRIRVATEHEEGARIFRSFNSRHPRLKVIRSKTLGVALIDLSDYADFTAFEKTVSGKNSAVYFSRRCAKLGYTFREIDPNADQDALLEIHASAAERQGRSIDASYHERLDYPRNEYNTYVGVFWEEKLVAYCWIVSTGELLLLSRMMGHNDHMKNNVMYKLFMDVIAMGFEKKAQLQHPLYIMYDTYYGASEGLKLFKRRLGFRPYRVKWSK